MKKTALLIFTLFIFNALWADIAVKSFRALPQDMDARIKHPLVDQNGDKCAIIKVVTTETNFEFDGGLMGIEKTVQKTAEIWVYVRWGFKKISIRHPQLGNLRDYMLPFPTEQEMVYEMVLTTGKVITIVEEESIESQWLVITPDPADALVYLNDEFKGTGEYQVKLKPGSYTYRVEKPLYHTDAGIINISNEKQLLPIKLRPAYGYIKINSSPESGAQVFVDGKLLTSTTPLTTERLASGEHTVQVVKDMYQPLARKVSVLDNQTTEFNAILQANFAELIVKTAEGASIYVNNQPKATTNWTSRLGAGVYTVEARLASHLPAKQDIELATGEKRTIELKPTPIYGSLDVMTSPSGAKISLNGKDYGTTPNTIKNLLIGDYTVELIKAGHATVKKTISITENAEALLSETLANGREVTINSDPQGADLYVDGSLLGKTPYKGNLSFGTHQLKIESGGKIAEQTVNITQTGGEADFMLLFGHVNFTEILKGVNIEMIGVEGGTFTMGCTSEKITDCFQGEKPAHSVKVSDFYIGKYQVTQAQWEAVMGASTTLSNPSYFSGWDNCPVEQVSWNDVQEFITELNRQTGKKYRLPTEAEWEYAARGGNKSKGYKYSGSNTINDVAWNSSNSEEKTHPVGEKQANELGIYDMSGNVFEWCSDWYGAYSTSTENNPQGPLSGTYRVLRGGSLNRNAHFCRSTYRYYFSPKYSLNSFGFRLVLSVD